MDSCGLQHLLEQGNAELPLGSQGGCIYFAPCNAEKVLRINAEANAKLLDPG